MASNPILAIDEDIDDQITEFCRGRDGIAEADVIRDIARIVCIVNLVQNGTLDGEQMVLCGGMAMRCLDSPRMSIFDGDTASRLPPDPSALPSAISHDEGRSNLERETRERVRGLVETKLGVNRRISGVQSRRIDALTEPIRRGRLLDPDEHLDNRHDFETLSYLHAERPRRAEIDRIVQRVVIPVLLDE